ncbi:MAG: GNAT family N-acetyltransferase [Actinobacteria bacterium]|nr:GNAT family N-acetyltransferase [Actinomycetota bacterium]
MRRLWPLFGLRVRTARLELRLPADDDLAALAELAAAGVHPPETMPFLSAWTDKPSPELERGMLRHHWRSRAHWTPGEWTLDLAVLADSGHVGMQGITATEFAVTRSVGTGSWLGRSHQGHGIGTEMRAAVLHLAFAGLGALEARSGAFTDNPASLAVSRRLGYHPEGHNVRVRRGQRAIERRLVLTRDDWEASERPAVTVDGLEPCLELFGADTLGTGR